MNRFKQFAYGVGVVVVGNFVYDQLAGWYNDHLHEVEDIKEDAKRAVDAVKKEFNDTEGEDVV